MTPAPESPQDLVATDLFATELFGATYARGEVRTKLGASAWVGAMLEVEVALAAAAAAEGLIPPAAGEAIADACSDGPSAFDLGTIIADSGDHATPVVPLVRELRARVDAIAGDAGNDYGRYVHLGATSQDVIDTATMLISRDALDLVLADASACAAACAALADRHRLTVMTGRTLLQQALPTTFGLLAAGWLSGIGSAVGELERVRDRVLAVQLGGPVGHGAPALAERVAAELNLSVPTLPWHTDRTRITAMSAALGLLCGSLAKAARDVTLLAGDIGELAEGSTGRGGSSAMAHKRNPVAAVSVLACARRVPPLVGGMLAGMEQELQRAAGAWQAEWGTVEQLLTLTGSAAAWARDLLEHLVVDDERMRSNLTSLADAGVPEAVSPELHLGASSELIDRALAVWDDQQS